MDKGTICSACQAADEQMEVQLNEAIGSSSDSLGPFEVMLTAIKQAGPHDGDESGTIRDLAGMLASVYPTPEAMRSDADKLTSLANAWVSLMRRIADEVAVSNRRWDHR